MAELHATAHRSIERDDILRGIEYWIFLTGRLLEESANGLLENESVTFRQLKLLGLLLVRGPLTQKDLASRLQVKPSAIVRIVDRMERDGWLQRTTDPLDKRKNVVVLTAAASELEELLTQCMEQIEDQALQGISKQDIATTIKTLSRICKNMSDDTPE